MNYILPATHTTGSLESIPRYILHPGSSICTVWNFLMAILLLHTATVMPFTLAFVETEGYDMWYWMDLVIDAIFFCDVMICFVSGYYDSEGQLVYSIRQIACRYVKSWFIIDIFSCFPFGLVESESSSQFASTSGDYDNLIRLLRLPKLYRLFKISRLLKLLRHYKHNSILDKIQDFLSLKHSIMKLLGTIFTIVICIHIVTCFWYYSAKIEGFNPETWVVRNELMESDILTIYITSLYWSITTICTVGYGDITAKTNLEKILAMSWMIVGLCFISFTISSVSSLLARLETKEHVLLHKLAAIDEFAKEAKLSKKLLYRLRYALKYSTEKKGISWNDKISILNELPKNLRYEVALAMHQGAAKRLKFFHKKDAVLIASIVPFLQPVYIKATECVYKLDEFADEIYFIVKGCISLEFSQEEIPIARVDRGDMIGEIEVTQNQRRRYISKAVRDCELLIMNKTVAIIQIINLMKCEYPKVWEETCIQAMIKDDIYSRSIIEYEQIQKLKFSGNLSNLTPKELKRMVDEEFLRQLKAANEIKKKEDPSLTDIMQKVELLESKVNTIMSVLVGAGAGVSPREARRV